MSIFYYPYVSDEMKEIISFMASFNIVLEYILSEYHYMRMIHGIADFISENPAYLYLIFSN